MKTIYKKRDGSNRVVRGGSWDNHDQFCRSAFRHYDSLGSRINSIGFRLSRNVKDDK